MAAGLLFVICASVALYFAQAHNPYNELPEAYKKGVDLAFEQLNSFEGVHHHFGFLRTVGKSEIEGGFGAKYLFHHFHLKPTRCAKGTPVSNPQSCPFRNDRPLMDCAICYKAVSDHIEPSPQPYIHCIQKPRVTEEVKTNRLEHCKKLMYHSGAPTLLAVSTG